MKKYEVYFFIGALLLFLSLFIYRYWKDNKIESAFVYVLAKVKAKTDTENGVIYDFVYVFNGVTYSSGIKGFIPLDNSFLMLKVSTSNPKLWKYIGVKVPKCILDFM